jgi:hypothetical protein
MTSKFARIYFFLLISILYSRHCFSPHFCVSDGAPSQSFPPLAGAGFVHVRVRDWLPPPHVTGHGAQELHNDHPPFIFTKNIGEILHERTEKNLSLSRF